MRSLNRTLVLGLIVVVLVATAGRALAQDRRPTKSELLDDFRHYVITRQDELAQAAGSALLSQGISPEEFVGLVEDSRFGVDGFEQAIRKGVFIDSVEIVASQLEQLYERGRRDKARNPDEIARNITLLGGNQRGRVLATNRLRFAGEYAAPQLLQVLLAKTNPVLEAEVERLLVSMGADVVAPLSAALLKVDPVLQEQLARILGATQHPAALAPLYELAVTTKVDAVRTAAQHAVTRIAGSFSPDLSVSDLYALLAQDYYEGSPSLTRFPGEPYQLLWTFEPELGIYATPIRTEVFHETMAMLFAEKSLKLDSANIRAETLWIGANFKREIDRPAGYENPVYGSNRRNALYYAVAAGPTVTQEVLARAMSDHDTPLARRVIGALRRSAGGAALWEGLSGDRPLLDALSYPDRRVQYDAALALGAANPPNPFPGADQVVPLLASAIRNGEDLFAVVVSQNINRQQEIATLLQTMGYTVLSPGTSLTEVGSAIAEAPGVDIIVADLLTNAAEDLIAEARSSSRLVATPILVMLPASGWAELRSRYENDPLTELRRQGIGLGELLESTRQLVDAAAGPPLGAGDTARYTRQALSVLSELAKTGSIAFNVEDASASLIAALETAGAGDRLQIADILSRVSQGRAQVALMDAALKSTAFDRVAMIEKVEQSVKLFGDMLKGRQIKHLVELANDADTSTATAAAALMGALNLHSGEFLDLIGSSR